MRYDLLKAGAASACSASLIISCATTDGGVVEAQPEPKWSANGFLTLSPDAEPEIIGLYAKRGECEEAVASWLARQIVGNPISGECLVIDPEYI